MKTLIVVSTRNKFGYLQMSLPQSYHRAGMEVNWVFIDDASSDGTWEYLAGFTSGNGLMRAIRNATPAGISANKNVGLTIAQENGYERLVFLDDDLLLSPFWLKRLIQLSTVHPDCLIAPIVVNDKTMLRKIESLGMQDVWAVDGLGGACVVVPETAFNLRFELRTNYQYEDAVFHNAATEAGFGLLVSASVTAVHLPWIVMLDPQQEYEKLKVRHIAIGGSPDTLEKSFMRNYAAVLNPFIKTERVQ
jgi:glycosyltransferase involved in cell wall biosynthesis